MDNIEKYRLKVERALIDFLEGKLEKGKHYSKSTKELLENVKEYTMRNSKRIRPVVMIFAYKCFKNDETVINASICIELLQSYLLMHDDFMDKSDLRRGKPTIHKVYEKRFDEHFGVSMGALAGDLCYSFVYDSILMGDFGEKEKLDVISRFGWINERER